MWYWQLPNQFEIISFTQHFTEFHFDPSSIIIIWTTDSTFKFIKMFTFVPFLQPITHYHAIGIYIHSSETL